MKINEIILNELKEYIDPNSYGAWINVNGEIDQVENHQSWLKKKYSSPSAYNVAFADGWIRVLICDNNLNLQGILENIKKTFKYWWPSVRNKNKILIDDPREENTASYSIPEDRFKLLKDFGPNNENK